MLRTIDTPARDQKPILIVTKEIPSNNVCLMLKMFRNVYVVMYPEDDDGSLSSLTLIELQIGRARHVVLATNNNNLNRETQVDT